jgi:hypothetical protein
MRRIVIVAAGLCLTLTSGCVSWRFEAPTKDVVLARCPVQTAVARVESGAWPRVHHRQMGLGALSLGSALIPADAIFPWSKISHRLVPMNDAVVVAGYHFTDWLIEALTYSIVKSHQVRVFADVR